MFLYLVENKIIRQLNVFSVVLLVLLQNLSAKNALI